MEFFRRAAKAIKEKGYDLSISKKNVVVRSGEDRFDLCTTLARLKDCSMMNDVAFRVLYETSKRGLTNKSKKDLLLNNKTYLKHLCNLLIKKFIDLTLRERIIEKKMVTKPALDCFNFLLSTLQIWLKADATDLEKRVALVLSDNNEFKRFTDIGLQVLSNLAKFDEVAARKGFLANLNKFRGTLVEVFGLAMEVEAYKETFAIHVINGLLESNRSHQRFHHLWRANNPILSLRRCTLLSRFFLSYIILEKRPDYGDSFVTTLIYNLFYMAQKKQWQYAAKFGDCLADFLWNSESLLSFVKREANCSKLVRSLLKLCSFVLEENDLQNIASVNVRVVLTHIFSMFSLHEDLWQSVVENRYFGVKGLNIFTRVCEEISFVIGWTTPAQLVSFEDRQGFNRFRTSLRNSYIRFDYEVKTRKKRKGEPLEEPPAKRKKLDHHPDSFGYGKTKEVTINAMKENGALICPDTVTNAFENSTFKEIIQKYTLENSHIQPLQLVSVRATNTNWKETSVFKVIELPERISGFNCFRLVFSDRKKIEVHVVDEDESILQPAKLVTMNNKGLLPSLLQTLGSLRKEKKLSKVRVIKHHFGEEELNASAFSRLRQPSSANKVIFVFEDQKLACTSQSYSNSYSSKKCMSVTDWANNQYFSTKRVVEEQEQSEPIDISVTSPIEIPELKELTPKFQEKQPPKISKNLKTYSTKESAKNNLKKETESTWKSCLGVNTGSLF